MSQPHNLMPKQPPKLSTWMTMTMFPCTIAQAPKTPVATSRNRNPIRKLIMRTTCRTRQTQMRRRRSTLKKKIPFKSPSFNQPIMEETLCDHDWPYVFWVSLQLPIPKDLVNPMAVVYDALEEFITQLAEEDPNFVVFPYHWSDFKSIDNLPPPIETADNLPDIDEWLEYFPQAKPRISRGDTYTALLIGLSVPFPN